MAADLALILHAHLPYVRPTGREMLEERWLYEAVAESYLPLLWALERLHADGVPVRMALSLSAPLLAMLSDPGLMSRCRAHLARIADLAEREATRLAGGPLGAAADFHRERYQQLVTDLDRRGGELVGSFRRLDGLELFTSAGTHACLPLLGSDEARRAQIEAGCREFARHFGRRPEGMWLPECAYAPGLEHLLRAAGIRWFVGDAAMVAAADPSVDGPAVLTPGGVAVLALEPGVCRQVWDSRFGYPGDPAYREFYKDAGYELPLADVRPWLVDGVRSDTGLKFYRVTGAGVDLSAKEPYSPLMALERVKAHAHHFASLVGQRPGLVVAPFDAELFGHWWFEGPLWIEALFRALPGAGVRPVAPGEWLGSQADLPVARLPAGSWGEGGDHRVWLAPENDWVWPRIHAAEQRMVSLVSDRNGLPDPALNQAARELLLAQASDWPFILYFKTAAEYARRRVRGHLSRFDAPVPEEGGIFPDLDARRLFRPRPPVPAAGPLRVLMLSWEFPPNNVGGLGRHVHDLGAALAAQGHRVTVITLADPGAPGMSGEEDGMRVVRVVRPPEQGSFLAWVYRMNQAMVSAAEALGERVDVVHSHDWLTGQAGMALKARRGAALVATIHATEKGRQGVIREPMQEAIHAEEWLLVSSADQVITVSRAMAREVAESFRVAPTVIYNGVTLPATGAAVRFTEPYFFYIGRLVAEKGVQVAIDALARLERRAHLVVAGRGPMEAELRSLAARLGAEGRVHFAGRVSDEARNGYLRGAVAGLVPSLYEPFGIVALEVMAAGGPVIVSDTGGLAEIVTPMRDGLVVPPGDAGALAAAMAWLLANPAEAARLGAAGRSTAAERFGWGAIAQQTLEVYRGN